jgi:NADPH2:quinone reductase
MGTYGTYAEFSAVAAKDAVLVPDALSSDKAAAAYLQGLTAWTFIREAGEVKAGQWVLVHAAAGGVGSLLVQMLRAVGAKTIGTASTEEKLALVRKNGAEYTINSHDDLVTKVKEITRGHGVDVIFDGVGKSTFDDDIEMIAQKGHLVSFGNAVSPPLTPRNNLRMCMLTEYSPALSLLSTSSASPPSASDSCVPSSMATSLTERAWKNTPPSSSK